MTRSRKNQLAPLYSIALLLLLLVAVIFAVKAMPSAALSGMDFRSMPPWAIPAIAIMHVVYLLASAEIWRRLVVTLTGMHCRYADAYLQMASVAAGKYVPGKVWGFVARTGQMSRIAIPARLAVVSSVVEQLAVLAGGMLVAIGAALVVFTADTSSILLAGGIMAVGLVYLSRSVPGITRWVQRRRGIAGEQATDLGAPPWRWLQFSLAYAVLWLINGLILGIVYISLFDTSVTSQTIAALVLANTIGFVVGFLAVFAPGGIGVREATTVAILSPFVPVSEALVAAVALRALMVFFDGLNGTILLVAELRWAVQPGQKGGNDDAI